MRKLFYLLMIIVGTDVYSQDTELPDFTALDSLYREDQFYVGFTYNILQKRPEGVRQNKFSMGLSAGFLRDMPVNKKRTFSIAAGLGYSLNNFNHNLQIAKIGDDDATYGIIGQNARYDKNKMILHYIDLPIEIRWRTSTPESHRFWRVYTGFKVSYLFFDNYKFKGSGGDYAIDGNPDLNKFLYGAYLATGYNTWNFHIYYGINPIFKSARLNNQPIDMHTLNVGLMFYIL
ncbi:MAG TPA: porin family protein [Flavobacterium sp.]|jgi:hypothetical protein